ncbi:MAG: DNA gyrase subunit A [Chloroflexota bacterium]|nr:DNA gyrase subunit A [Chloroflexota bacterium]
MEVGVTKPVNIEEEMKISYLDYAMSVIISRALPDARDGLKPVQRRVLYAMNELGLHHNNPYKKSARIVGEVLGKYHPHGDAPVYEAMVRMAQDFSLRYILVEGQGNFGSIDNDPPAAMRYTEARLAEITKEMLVDIDKNTVDFVPNFDDSLKEPSVLPARVPNLLINGSAGIAVGMATNIPPHNLGEICDAIIYLIDNPQATTEELMEFVKGPDFPTGGTILGREGIETAYATGQGKIIIQAKASEVILKGNRRQIIITELPYQVNKSSLVERIANLVKERKITGIAEVRDESDREGMRIVIDLKRETDPKQVFNNLYKNTPMQSAFFINMVALVNGQPKLLGLKEALSCYIDFRAEVIQRRSRFEMGKAKDRAHILEGFKIALDNMEEVIKIIRHSENVDAARNNLIRTFNFTPVQAQAILDIPLRRLTHLEREKIIEEYTNIIKNISYLEDLLASPGKILQLIVQDVKEIKSKYSDPRHTLISEEKASEFRQEDLIPHEKMFITLTTQGFIKRISVNAYRLQHRGGKGVMGMTRLKSDTANHTLIADTHDDILFFTNKGKVYSLKCYKLFAESSRGGKGLALVNLLPIDLKDKITALVSLSLEERAIKIGNGEKISVQPIIPNNLFLLIATKNGAVKKTPLAKFTSVRKNGIIAMTLRNDDLVVSARIVTDNDEAILVTRKGQSLRFKVKNLRSASRNSGGVHGIRLSDDYVVGVDVISNTMNDEVTKQVSSSLKEESRGKDSYPPSYVLTITHRGFGKLTPVKNYPTHNRGGKGVRACRVSQKTGDVATFKIVSQQSFLIILSAKGNVLGTPIKQISVQSRNGSGVHLMALDNDDEVASLATFD